MTISREVQSIIDFAESTGIPYRITSTIRRPPAGQRPTSYHEQAGTLGEGLAVDFAGVMPGVTTETVAQMAALYFAFIGVASQLAELIFNAPGITQAVKNGRRVDGRNFYGPLTWGDHRDHVHVAVPRGIFLTPLPHPVRTLEANVPDDPNVHNIDGPVKIRFFTDPNTGACIGYYQYSEDTGEVHGYGPGAPYHGRSEVVAPGG